MSRVVSKTSVELHTIVLGVGTASATVNLAASDTTQCVPYVSHRMSNGADDFNDCLIDVEFLTGPNRLQVTRNGTAGEVTIKAYVVQYCNNVSIQTGTFSLPDASVDVTVSAVDLAKTFAVFSYQSDNANQEFNDAVARGMLTTTTNLHIERADTPGQLDGHWWTVEDIDPSGRLWDIQRVIALSITGTTADATITAVDDAKTFLQGSQEMDSAGDDPDEVGTCFLFSATVVRYVRDVDDGTATLDCFVVELLSDGDSIQRGSITLGSGTEIGTAAITAIELPHSFANNPMQHLGAQSDDAALGTEINVAFGSVELNSGTEIEANAADNTSIEVVQWEAIELEDVTEVDLAVDALAVTDAVAVEMEYGRVIGDAVAVTDQTAASVVTVEREVSDAVAVTDAIAIAMDYARTISDAVSVTDADQVSIEVSSENTDAVAVVDQLVTALEYGRSVPDSVPVTDAIAIEMEYALTVSDSVAVADAVTPSITSKVVRLLDPWVVDGTYATEDADFIPNPAGDCRMVLVCLSAESDSGTAISVTSVSLGDQVLTELFQFIVGDPADFHNLHWVGYLLEDEIAARTGDGITISYATAPNNPFDEPHLFYASYSNVDQDAPIRDSDSNSSTAATSLQLPGTITAELNDKIAAFNVLGQENSPALTTPGYTEEAEFIGPTNGHAAATYHRTATSAVTENPTFTSSASDRMAVSAWVMAAKGGELFEVTVNDTAAVTDAVAIEMEFERVISDAVSVADVVVIEADYARTISDAIAVNDAVAVGLEYAVTLADVVTVADAVAVEMEFGRVISDAISVADEVQREHDAAREISDAVAVADQVGLAFEIELSDAVSVADTIVREHDANRITNDGASVVDQVSIEVHTALPDDVGVADQLVTEVDYARSATNAIFVTDALAAGLEIGVEVSDAVAVADAVASELEYGRVVSDALVVADEAQREHDAAREISDAITVVDQVGLTFEIELSDAVAIADAIAREHDAARDLTDAVTVVDELISGPVIEISDAISVADAVAREHDANRAISDAITVVDTIVAQIQGVIAVEISDAISVADAVAREHDAAREISDAIAVVDEAGLDFLREVSDAVSVADVVTIVLEYERSITDNVALTDADAREHTAVRDVSDSLVVADAVAVERQFDRTVSDAVGVADQTQREHDAVREISDAVAVADLVSITGDTDVTDTVAVADAVTVELEYARTVSDAVAVVDAVVVDIALEKDATDAVAVADAVAIELEYARTVADAVAVADATATAVALEIVITDSLAVADEAVVGSELPVIAADVADVADLLQTEAIYARTADDAVGVADAANAEIITGADIAISDVIAVTDQVVAALDTGAGAGDDVDVADLVEAEITLGASAQDAVVVTDVTTVDLFSAAPDTVSVEDELLIEVSYVRGISDAVTPTDAIFEGDIVLLAHGIDGGVNDGPVRARTVDSDGPVDATGGTTCETTPVGFVVRIGDHVEYNDNVEVSLNCHVVIGDSVGVTG